ncbi:MAG: lipopolysaccharide biosynthesis protein [Treponema sp.]|nr:lipopolysaccharide biosynthesis protein [Treponema sp.]MCL2192081.1 lipopolysaccharide biosynthesis protein [Treponema sp.]MCL2192144.1 lipopolysaccharide biosynthesis protein [Treponema sp.]
MNEETKKEDGEISLIDLFAVLWRRKVMIIVITMTAAVGVVIFSIITIVLPPEISPLPDVFTPRALMLIDDSASPGGGMGMGGGMAAFAGLGGIRTGATFSDLAVFLFGTHSLLDSVVDEFNIIERFDIDEDRSPRAESRDALRRLLRASFDDRSGVLTVSFTDRDPVFARDVVNFVVEYLEARFDTLGLDRNRIEQENLETNLANVFRDIIALEEESRTLEQSFHAANFFGEMHVITADINRIAMELGAMRQVYTQLRVQNEMLKVTIASETPMFQILELAEAPDRKSSPSRGLICVIVTLAAGFFSVFLAFALNAISNIRNDPEAMAKLRGARA